MIDWIGWVGTGIMALGSIDIAHKRVRGLWLMLVGNGFWGIVGVYTGLTSLVGVSIMMGVLDIYGIKCWASPISGRNYDA